MNLDEMKQKRVVCELPGMDQVTVRKEIVYKTVNDLALKMDLYLPADRHSDTRYPCVVFVHGDAPWEVLGDAKDWGQYTSWGRLTAASGMAAVTFVHRSSERFRKAADVAGDVSDLLTYVTENARTLGIDCDRIGVWVGSAGTPFGLRAVLERPLTFVRAVAVYYGFMDLQQLRGSIPPTLSDDDLQRLSAVHYLNLRPTALPPMLVVKAGQDSPAINQSIDLFAGIAAAAGARVTTLTHEEGHHAFDILDDNDRSREVIRQTLDFFRDHLAAE